MCQLIRELLQDGWLQALHSFRKEDRCTKCQSTFTHIWLDTLNKETYVMCIPCRDKWVSDNSKRIVR